MAGYPEFEKILDVELTAVTSTLSAILPGFQAVPMIIGLQTVVYLIREGDINLINVRTEKMVMLKIEMWN